MRRTLLTGAVITVVSATFTMAQTDDFGGSFGGDAPAVVPTPPPSQTPPAVGGDDFGGNFGGGGDAPPPASGGDDTFGDDFGGNFDGGGTAPVVADETPPPASDGSLDPDFEVGIEAPAPPEVVVDDTPPPPENTPGTGIQIPPEILAFESQDFGVPPPSRLRQGEFHAPTPIKIPGGFVVSTENLAIALDQGMDLILIDVLGGDYSLPTAFVEPLMSSAGNFNDRIQQQTAQWLARLTEGVADYPIVLYCSDPMCWLSYNAALRAIAAGYTNVYWYRGGIQAWSMAGLPTVPSGF